MTRETPGSTMRHLGAAALLLSFAVLLSRVVGYLRDAYIAARFGAGPLTDAYYDAYVFPDWLNYLVAGGTLSITFLPIYARHLSANDEAAANRALSTVATFVVGIAGLGVVGGVVFAEPLVELYFHRLPPEAREACVRYTRILFPAQFFHFLNGVLAATLLARKRFGAVALAPIVYTLGIIGGGVLLGDRLGHEALAWGSLAGAALGPGLIVGGDAIRRGARIVPRLHLRDPDFVQWIKLSLPLMIGVSLVTVDDFILRYFASDVPGAVTHLNNAKRLAVAAIAIAGQAVGQASMPFFASLFAENRREALADVFLRTIRGAGTVALLLAALMVSLAEPAVHFLFGRGAYTAIDVEQTAQYFAIFSAAVPLWVLQGLAARLFYSARNTLTPMIAGTVVTVLAIPVYALAFHRAGIVGLAVASGAGIAMHTGAIFLLAPRILPELRGRSAAALSGLLRALLLAAASGLASHFATQALVDLLPAGHLGSLLLCAAGGTIFVLVAGLLSPLLGIDAPRRLARRLLRR